MATAAITPDQDVVTAEIFIAAPPERETLKWWGQRGMYRVTEWNSDLRPGGKWSSLGMSADGSTFRVDGEYLEVETRQGLSESQQGSFRQAGLNLVHTMR